MREYMLNEIKVFVEKYYVIRKADALKNHFTVKVKLCINILKYDE